MEGSPPDGDVSVSLFTRTSLPGPSRRRADAVSARLEALATDGSVQAVERETWPKRVPVDDCDSRVRDVYLDWIDWARREEVSLRPFFATRECYDPAAEDFTDWLVVPAIALAVRVDGNLAAVYPHEDGDQTVTVEDGLEDLVGTGHDGPGSRLTVAD